MCVCVLNICSYVCVCVKHLLIRLLCVCSREILVEESNVQRVDSPVTVSIEPKTEETVLETKLFFSKIIISVPGAQKQS